MIAARTSLIPFLSLLCALAATYCTVDSPKRLPFGCGRNVYWRLRSFRTASAIAVVSHRNFCCLSTFSASGTERPPGRKVALTLARLPGQNHPLLARPAHDRARRRHRPLDAEARREEATHLGLRHRERRAGATAADRKEAGQEPAARLQDRRDRVHVLPAPARIDRAVARVLPQPVERVDLVAAEREPIALPEGHLDAVALGQGPSGLEGGRREIESDDVVAVAGQQPRVVAAPAAGHGDASPRRRRRLEEMDE